MIIIADSSHKDTTIAIWKSNQDAASKDPCQSTICSCDTGNSYRNLYLPALFWEQRRSTQGQRNEETWTLKYGFILLCVCILKLLLSNFVSSFIFPQIEKPLIWVWGEASCLVHLCHKYSNCYCLPTSRELIRFYISPVISLILRPGYTHLLEQYCRL